MDLLEEGQDNVVMLDNPYFKLNNTPSSNINIKQSTATTSPTVDNPANFIRNKDSSSIKSGGGNSHKNRYANKHRNIIRHMNHNSTLASMMQINNGIMVHINNGSNKTKSEYQHYRDKTKSEYEHEQYHRRDIDIDDIYDRSPGDIQVE